jgi:hypothetical protein
MPTINKNPENPLMRKLLSMSPGEIDELIESSPFFQRKNQQAIDDLSKVKNLFPLPTENP